MSICLSDESRTIIDRLMTTSEIAKRVYHYGCGACGEISLEFLNLFVAASCLLVWLCSTDLKDLAQLFSALDLWNF